MKRLRPFVALLSSSTALAHEGHAATPAHVHVGVAAIDVGAAVAGLVVGALLLVLARRRAR